MRLKNFANEPVVGCFRAGLLFALCVCVCVWGGGGGGGGGKGIEVQILLIIEESPPKN